VNDRAGPDAVEEGKIPSLWQETKPGLPTHNPGTILIELYWFIVKGAYRSECENYVNERRNKKIMLIYSLKYSYHLHVGLPPALPFRNSAFCPQIVFMCFE
jgi:hypothetical protein